MWHTLGESSFEIWSGTTQLARFQTPEAGFVLAKALMRQGLLERHLVDFLQRAAWSACIRDESLVSDTPSLEPSRLHALLDPAGCSGGLRHASGLVSWPDGTGAIRLGGRVFEIKHGRDWCPNRLKGVERGRIRAGRFEPDPFRGCLECTQGLRGLVKACNAVGPLNSLPPPEPREGVAMCVAWFGPRRAGDCGGPAPQEDILA